MIWLLVLVLAYLSIGALIWLLTAGMVLWWNWMYRHRPDIVRRVGSSEMMAMLDSGQVLTVTLDLMLDCVIWPTWAPAGFVHYWQRKPWRKPDA